jgi:hypothetical protein
MLNIENLSVQDIDMLIKNLIELRKRKISVMSLPTENNDYYNPYECGSRQRSLPSQYYNNGQVLQNQSMNIDIENSLKRDNSSRDSQHKILTETENNRYDKRSTSPMVWDDNMPRGGYTTRTERKSIF